MKKQTISPALLGQLEHLCLACPKGVYMQSCPFRLLNTLSHASQISLLQSLTVEQVRSLFDLIHGCTCPVEIKTESIEVQSNPPEPFETIALEKQEPPDTLTGTARVSLNERSKQMKGYIRRAISLVAIAVAITAGTAHADDAFALSSEDEDAYKAAFAVWEILDNAQKEAGLPSLSDPPKREDFVGISAQRAEAAEHDAAARKAAEERWRKRVDDAKPYLRSLVRPGETKMITVQQWPNGKRKT